MSNEIDHQECLSTIIKYMRGEINLHDAEIYLDKFGFDRASVNEVLNETERSNIVSIKQNQKE